MTESPKPNDFEKIDDELARFADRVVANEEPEMSEMSGQNQELLALEQTVTRLDRMSRASEPESAMSSRIRANLVREWQRAGQRAGKSSFWSRWLSMPSVTQPQLAGIAAAIVALALVVLALPVLVTGFAAPVAGAAGNLDLSNIPAWFVAVGIGLIGVAGVLWFVFRRRR